MDKANIQQIEEKQVKMKGFFVNSKIYLRGLVIGLLLGILFTCVIYIFKDSTKKQNISVSNQNQLSDGKDYKTLYTYEIDKEEKEREDMFNISKEIASSDFGVSTYMSKDLKISFNYPNSWGFPMEKVIDNGFNRYINLYGLIDDYNYPVNMGTSLVSAVNKEISMPPRGGGWIDEGFQIKNEEYIKNYCVNKSDCEIYRNKNGILFFREIRNACRSCQYKALFYCMYNQYSDYHGVCFTSSRLEDFKIVDLWQKFDKLIDSVNTYQ